MVTTKTESGFTYNWVLVAALYWVTKQQIEGSPDFRVYREGGPRMWYLKGRTSARRKGPYENRETAMKAAW